MLQSTDTLRLVAGYAAPGTPKIVLIEAGSDPALPPLRRLLDSDPIANGDAHFAYASVQGKGLVILRLGNKVRCVFFLCDPRPPPGNRRSITDIIQRR